MALEPRQIEQMLGATHVTGLPDVGGGAFGAARALEIVRKRVEPSSAGRSRPEHLVWSIRQVLPISKETEDRLILLADQMSREGKAITPQQLAAKMIEEAIHRRE